MTFSARRRLFYALVALFLVLGAGVVLYAQGWRLDFTTGHVDKVGAIYVRSFPVDASITLNGKPVQNQSGFLSRGTLITDLFPKSYQLKLIARGYDDWHENAGVSPSLVTEFTYAVLVPQNATSAASGTVANFLASQKALAATNASNTAALVAALAAGSSSIANPIANPNIPGTHQKILLVRNSLLGILQNDGSLYLYDADAHRLQKLADDVKDFFPSADGSMVAALERASIEIFSLNDPSGYYRFNLPDIANAKRLLWYKDRSHLFVVYKNSISFLDFADAGLRNFTTVAGGLVTTGPTPAYDAQTNSLYVTAAGPNRSVMRFDFPQ